MEDPLRLRLGDQHQLEQHLRRPLSPLRRDLAHALPLPGLPPRSGSHYDPLPPDPPREIVPPLHFLSSLQASHHPLPRRPLPQPAQQRLLPSRQRPRRQQSLERRASRGIRILVAGHPLSPRRRLVDLLQHDPDAPPVLRVRHLQVGDMRRRPRRPAHRDRLRHRLREPVALVPHVKRHRPPELPHHPRQRHDLLRRREASRRVQQPERHPRRPLPHPLPHPRAHPAQLLPRRRPILRPHHAQSHRPVRHQRGHVHRRPALFHRRPILPQRPEPAPAQRLLLRPVRPPAAVPHHLRRHPLRHLRPRQRVVQQVDVRMAVAVDEPRSHHQPRGLQHQPRAAVGDIAHGLDPPTAHHHIGPARRPPSAVDHPPAANQDIAHFLLPLLNPAESAPPETASADSPGARCSSPDRR